MQATKVSCFRIQYPCIEIVCDHGFGQSDACALQKNEDTWYDMLGHLRCRIRYSPESIQRAVAKVAYRAIPMVIRTCSTLIATMMANG